MHRAQVPVLCFLFFLLASAVTSLASENRETVRQTPFVGASSSYLAADNFDSALVRFSSRLMLGKIDDYSIHGETDLGYRRTRESTTFPEELYKIGVKISAAERLNHFEVGISSSSDKLFDKYDDLSLYLSASRKVMNWDNSSLRLGLAYSSRLDYPLPLLLYSYADSNLSLTIGLPIASLRWKLDEKTLMIASYQPVRQTRLALEHRLYPTLRLTLEGSIEEESYYVAGRRYRERALVLEIPKIAFKVNKRIIDQLELGVSVGRSFAGRFFERKGFFKEYNEERISDAWVSAIELRYSF